VKGIADTGFIVAFANRSDEHHAWAVGIAAQLGEPLLTCEAVLAEAAFHLQDCAYVFTLLETKLLRLAFDAHAHVPRLEALAKRYADRRPDFADLCLIVMSELHPQHRVVTVDIADFRVYRRNQREVIPTVFPPAKRR
jgi:predicted nucleic acid-binding protein